VETYDTKGEGEMSGLATCELCGCTAVRFVHVMGHDDHFELFKVRCECAGVMEGDLMAAKDRERLVRNRAGRKRRFALLEWGTSGNGNKTLRHKGKRVTIIRSKFGGFGVVFDGATVWRYRDRRIMDMRTAVLAAFDLIDPPVKAR